MSLSDWPWIGLAVLLPLVALLLFVTQPGRDALHHFFGRTQTAAVLPGFTVEKAMSPDVGLVVTSLRSDSVAAAQNISVGDRIIAIDDQPVDSTDKAAQYMHDDRSRTIRLELLHGNQRRRIVLPTDRGATDGA